MNKWVEAMLSFGRSSDELHEEIVTTRQRREEHIKRNGGSEDDYEDARGIARGRHTEVERAVAWIEAHPNAGADNVNERTFALLSAQGTACAETALRESDYTDIERERVEREAKADKSADAPVPGTWTDVSRNDVCAMSPITIYGLMQQVRAHPDFVFGTVFTTDDFPDGVPDDFPAKQGDELLAETGNLLIESEGG